MSNKLILRGLDAVGATGTITPVTMRSKDQCIRELEQCGIDLGDWERGLPGCWVRCFVPPAAEKWLRETRDYLWNPDAQ